MKPQAMQSDSLEFEFEHFIREELQLSETKPVYCELYQNGQCTDRRCPLLHIKLSSAVVCKHWLRGLCKKNERCEFLHEYNLKKMPECFFFNVYGICNNADCIFLHVKPDSAVRECMWYKRGFCKNGSTCKNKHIRREMCWDFYAGFCAKGKDCELGHPKFTLEFSEIKDEDVIQKSRMIR
ncbi:cleavage and polyadenylation specificity factor subunit 4 [Enteropsectra breve]|nr:cleavage and polyadenylation specificity factor subunit 4 [Enteropsectra breve]